MKIATTLALLAAWLIVAPVHLAADATPAEIQKVDGMLAASKYTATRVNNPTTAVWTIARHGETVGDFRILVTVDNGMVVTFVTVAEKKNIRRTTELIENILKMNNDFDYVKVGFDNDSDAMVRIDALLRVLDVQELNDIITQVGNVTDLVYKALKPFLIR